MRYLPVKRLSRVLSAAVYFFLLCNVVILILLPFLLANNYSMPDYNLPPLAKPGEVNAAAWDEYILSLCVFYPSGISSLLFLWQGRAVLRNLGEENPFTRRNALCMKRAAYCCFVISLAALIRQIIWCFSYTFWAIFVSYNMLFLVGFFLAGLFCLLVAELFRQAAVLREDNSLVI